MFNIKNVTNFYKNVSFGRKVFSKIQISDNLANGFTIHFNSLDKEVYDAEFYAENQLHFSTKITDGHFAKVHRQYYTDWLVKIKKNGETVSIFKPNLQNERVFITFESKALGDSIAWFPYVEEFHRKHGCHLIVSTFWNKLFKDSYPEIEFVEPGEEAKNLYAIFNIGCFDENNRDKSPTNWRKIPLQRIASDILGLEHKEIRPKIHVPRRTTEEKVVCIGTESTLEAKFWNNPDGWTDVSNYLNQKGYKVVNLSINPRKISGVFNPELLEIENIISLMDSCEFFIGLGSGLSWLAWALNKPVVMISGFSEKWAEFTDKCYRIINENVCHGCFNDTNCAFERGKWDWCPRKKNFICTKSITSEMVIAEIEKLIKEQI